MAFLDLDRHYDTRHPITGYAFSAASRLYRKR
jgi:hypothetical protein